MRLHHVERSDDKFKFKLKCEVENQQTEKFDLTDIYHICFCEDYCINFFNIVLSFSFVLVKYS